PDGRHHLAYALSFAANDYCSLRSIAAVPHAVEAPCNAWVSPRSTSEDVGK
ncbi:hypothetical protein K523DRAFT_211898, partial [Schizophyllum commune Tattone D]